MDAIQLRAIHRQHRILKRAVKRGERPATDVQEFVALHPEVFGFDREPNIDTPFRTRDGKHLPIDGMFAGSPLFLVLGGPSIRQLDLSLLNRRGVITMGVNNSPALFRTHLWTFVDPPHKFHDAIWRDPAIVKLVPVRLWRRPIRTKSANGEFSFIHRTTPDGHRELFQCGDMPGVVGYERNAFFAPARWLVEPSINWGNSMRSHRANKHHRCLNTMFAALKLAYTLGFRIVYLLGCDFKMDAAEPYAFSQGGDSGKAASNNNGYAVMQEMFAELKPHFVRHGFSVFNCNPESGLTVFPHVPYMEAIKSATRHVPQSPLDTSHWYDPISGGNPQPIAGATDDGQDREKEAG